MSQQRQQSQKNVISAFWIFATLVIVVIAFGFGLYFHTLSSKKNNSIPIEIEESNDSKDEKSEFQTNAHEISISKAECGYYLPSSKVAKYTADNLIDDNIKTAWAVNLDSPIYDCDALFGPIFTVNCNTVSEVVIVNGYGKDEASFFNNTRAAWITVYRVDYMVEEFPNESDIIYRRKLKDTVESQSLVVSPNFDNSKPTNKIGLIFSTKNSDGYYFGRKWNDLCISEFKVYGNSIGTGKLETNEQLANNEEWIREEAEENQMRLDEERMGPEWINGIWELNTTVSTALGAVRVNAKVCIDRESQQLVATDCGTTVAKGAYRISGNTIYCGDTYIDMDINNQRLEYGNGYYYRKVSDRYL